jgi:hypothetical protein
MKVLFAGKLLAKQARAPNYAGCIENEAAVGFVFEKDLP